MLLEYEQMLDQLSALPLVTFGYLPFVTHRFTLTPRPFDEPSAS
jgi:hypothetical protein